jgi:hypothetical protein
MRWSVYAAQEEEQLDGWQQLIGVFARVLLIASLLATRARYPFLLDIKFSRALRPAPRTANLID